MDPVSLQAPSAGVVRPAIALQADLSAVLREGRVLAGEVLQTFGGGTLLVGIGRHRVPAQGQVELRQGERFLFVVEGQGQDLVLRVLANAPGEEPALLRALRSVLGDDQPLGELLAALARTLAEGDASARSLLADLSSHVARPAESAPTPRAQLQGGGLAYEARLALPAALSLSAPEAGALAQELESWLARSLPAPPAEAPSQSPDRGSFLPGLREQLLALLGAGPRAEEVEPAFQRWLAQRTSTVGPAGQTASESKALGQLLEAAAARLFAGPARAGMLAALRQIELGSLGPGLEAILLRRLLGLPAGAPSALAARAVELAQAVAASDLKGRLLRALGELPEGPGREALGKALAGIEAEQLLNLARREAQEAQQWSFPVADGERWTTAHLFVERRADGEAVCGGDPSAWRLVLALELSRTGPVRADVFARPGAIVARVQVASERVAQELTGRLADLCERLAIGGRAVQVRVAVAEEKGLRIEAAAADVRYLRENHLMDRSA